MKAAQFFGRADIRVVDVPKPEAKENEAVVAVEWCGICGSDLHEYQKGPLAIPPPDRPHPATGDVLPITMGHEFAGRIVSAPVGSGLEPGQPVMVDPRIYCFKGLSGTGGGFSEFVTVDAKLCYPLPHHVDLSLAALIEPLAVAWHAISSCDISDWSNKTSLILGGGPVGIACALVLRAHGCKRILVSEPSSARAVQNHQIADAVFNPIQENVGDRCRELTAGEGADVAFDCAGAQKGLDAGFDALRYRGLYMNVAVWSTPMIVPFAGYILKETTMKSALAYTDNDFKATVDAFVAGKFTGFETMVTSRIHLDDIVQSGFEELVQHKDNHIKILVTSDRSKV